MAFLEIERAFKGYGPKWDRSEVLADINLEVEEGEFVAIVGFSGAGKTTLINLLSGLITPDKGAARFEGKPITGPGPERGIVFQNYSLLPWLTVHENIALAVDQLFPQWTARQRKEQVEKYIALVNLTPAAGKLPRELSGGMRQRVAVARALATGPRVLLLDEPLSALDALTRANLQDEVTRIKREDDTTIVLITNDPDEAILLADRVIPLTAGPGATLGMSIPITIPRPRDRRTIANHPDFKRIRLELVEYLLKSAHSRKTTFDQKLVLPDIEPEDLSLPRPVLPWIGRRGPIRRSEIKTAVVEVEK
jgi:nitrate/nitrite transport system ATP-binding protein